MTGGSREGISRGGRPCGNCGADVISGDRFCANCGTPVGRNCEECGSQVQPSDRFCPTCGAVQLPTGAGTTEFGSIWTAILRRLRTGLANDYRIKPELGRGGQAAVFLAEERSLQRNVAIKVLAPGTLSDDAAVQRFLREARTVAALEHEHIVPIYAVRQVEELHCFVMRYLVGRSLAGIIKDCGQLPLNVVSAIAFQVGAALQYAHRRSVIHRDIKPANVLFSEEGNAIVTDFGIAKDLSGVASTVTGMLMGTPAYMSPEQCLQRPLTWSSDQYSLGIVIYEMLTGQVPFTGTDLEVMNGHTAEKPLPLRSLRSDCPVEMEWAVLRMIAKQPSERWPSMGEALEALGARPLAMDDPIRTTLRELALQGQEARGAAVTPTDPSRRTDLTPAGGHVRIPDTPRSTPVPKRPPTGEIPGQPRVSGPVTPVIEPAAEVPPPEPVEVESTASEPAWEDEPVAEIDQVSAESYRDVAPEPEPERIPEPVVRVSGRVPVWTEAKSEWIATGEEERAPQSTAAPVAVDVSTDAEDGARRAPPRVFTRRRLIQFSSIGLPVVVALAVLLKGKDGEQVTPGDPGGVASAPPTSFPQIPDSVAQQPVAPIVAERPTSDTTLRLRIAGIPESVVPGESMQLRATASRGGRTAEPPQGIRWESLDRSVVTIDAQSGRVSVVGPGAARIRAASGGLTADARILVTPRVATRLSVEAPARMTAGESRILRVTAVDQRGSPIPAEGVSWQVSDPAVASIDPSGNLRALRDGAVSVEVRIGSALARHALQVEPRAVAASIDTNQARPAAGTGGARVDAPPQPAPSGTSAPARSGDEGGAAAVTEAELVDAANALGQLIRSKDTVTLRVRFQSREAADQKRLDDFIRFVAQRTPIEVRPARAATSPQDRQANLVRARITADWASSFGRRTADIDFVFAASGGLPGTRLRQYRIGNAPRY